MEAKTSICGIKLLEALNRAGSLDLWEARAVLVESRESTISILRRFAASGTVECRQADGRLVFYPVEPAG